jgi:hypothetical protein
LRIPITPSTISALTRTDPPRMTRKRASRHAPPARASSATRTQVAERVVPVNVATCSSTSFAPGRRLLRTSTRTTDGYGVIAAAFDEVLPGMTRVNSDPPGGLRYPFGVAMAEDHGRQPSVPMHGRSR